MFTKGDKFSRYFSQGKKALLVTDLNIKPTDTHQYLHASSCQVYHFKKSLPYSQALRLNRICSENSSYDKRCNELEVWLRERGYSDKLVGQQVLKARRHKRKDLLNDMEDKRNDYKLVFNITYHSNFASLKDTMPFLQVLLTPDLEQQKVFHKVPIIGFCRMKSFKDILVRAKVPPVKKNKVVYGPRNKSRYEICEHNVSTDSFKTTTTQRTYFIRPENLKCSSENLVCLFT